MSSAVMDSVLFQNQPVGDWLRQLNHPDGAVRQRAAAALAETAGALAEVIPALSGSLRQVDAGARAQLARALGAVGVRLQAALPALQNALKTLVVTDANAEVRASALHALNRTGTSPRTQVPNLTESLNDMLAYVRASAAQQLGQLGPEAQSAIPALTTVCARDPDLRTRVEAAVALWRIDRKAVRALPVLTEALAAADESLRWTAADCLGEMGAEARDAVPALVEALQQPISARLVRLSLETALERIDPRAAARLGV